MPILAIRAILRRPDLLAFGLAALIVVGAVGWLLPDQVRLPAAVVLLVSGAAVLGLRS